MMRSLFSGVAGLKTHQTKMDVIGNNIANVNTVGYKASAVTFNSLLYQTSAAASGANDSVGGTNAKQIGLGVRMGSITQRMNDQGTAQSTGKATDLMMTGNNFFIVKDGANTYFTRDGSFYVDGAGTLCMAATGYRVQGWRTEQTTEGELIIKKEAVQDLPIMTAENLTYPPEATSKSYLGGILDKNDSQLDTDSGKIVNLNFYDELGYAYTARLSIHRTSKDGNYYMQLDDIRNSNGASLVDIFGVDDIGLIASLGNNDYTVTKNASKGAGTQFMTSVTASKSNMLTRYTIGQDANGRDAILDTQTSNSPVVYFSGGTAYDSATNQELTLGDLSKYYNITLTGSTTDTLSQANCTVNGGTIVVPTNIYYTYTNPNNPSDTFRLDVQSSGVGIAEGDLPQVINISDMFYGNTDLTALVDANNNNNPIGHEYFNKIFGTSLTAKEFSDIQSVTINKDGTISYNITLRDLNSVDLSYNTDTGVCLITNPEAINLTFRNDVSGRSGQTSLRNFGDDNQQIVIDVTSTKCYNNGKTSTINATAGALDTGVGSGRKVGKMTGFTVAKDGMIHATYDNGQTKLLGQISTASFANAEGLTMAGDNLYQESLNSGMFDGIGEDITASGEGYISSGVLEMSNVDLSTEFTEMITTQRGFQANSRIITVSDTMLEELTNLKR